MKKFLGKVSVVAVGVMIPVFAFAQTVGDTGNGLLYLINRFQQLIQAVIPVLIGLALLGFMWGILQYVFGKKEDGKNFMIWGIIALFVMTSVWGLVSILRSTILPNSQSNTLDRSDIPTVPAYR
jgi:hypothetical protein